MRQHRSNTIPILTLLALAGCCLFVPAVASAGSLLSGYGGPGQGSQEILGATLVNGPSGGGGGGGGGGPAGGEASGRGTGSGGGQGTSGGQGGGLTGRASGQGARRSSRGAESGKHAATGGEASWANGFGAHGALSLRPASQPVGVAAPALGLSDADLVYIFLILGALVATGVLTRQLARRPRQGS